MRPSLFAAGAALLLSTQNTSSQGIGALTEPLRPQEPVEESGANRFLSMGGVSNLVSRVELEGDSLALCRPSGGYALAEGDVKGTEIRFDVIAVCARPKSNDDRYWSSKFAALASTPSSPPSVRILAIGNFSGESFPVIMTEGISEEPRDGTPPYIEKPISALDFTGDFPHDPSVGANPKSPLVLLALKFGTDEEQKRNTNGVTAALAPVLVRDLPVFRAGVAIEVVDGQTRPTAVLSVPRPPGGQFDQMEIVRGLTLKGWKVIVP